MSTQKTPETIDEYIAGLPRDSQRVMEKLRALVRKTVPGVTERISYAIPTFDVNGRYLVYLAAWKKHISMYPLTAGLLAGFEEEIKPYRSGKGTLKFPLSQPLPIDLIRRLIESRYREVSGT